MSNEISHTPGPWEPIFSRGGGWSVRRQLERPGYKGLAPICSMAWFQFPIEGIINDEISGANAKLIAAAPELLEAIKRIQHFITGACDMPLNRRLKCIEMECEASIAKALQPDAATNADLNGEKNQ